MNETKALRKMLSNVGDVGLRRRVKTIIRYLDIQDDDVVLDCGCGEGFLTKIISELYDCEIYGLDIDEDLLEAARQNIGDKNNVVFQHGDIINLPFRNETFDKIILMEVLEHIPDDAGALRELHRVLRKGGILAITVPNHNYPFLWDPLNKIREGLGLGHFSKDKGFLGGIWAMHLRLYHPNEIKEVIERAGFAVEDMEGLMHYCLPFNHNILYFGKQIVYKHVPLPQSIHDSMDKFAWKSTRQSTFNPIPLLQRIVNAVDALNDNFDSLEESSMCIAARAVKEE